MNFDNIYSGKTVLITGHTGFKGSWISEWLMMLGARVIGYALAPPSAPSCFEACQVAERITADIRADVESLEDVHAAIDKHRPDFIFHLAAQPLVRMSYRQPYETVMTNYVGSMNVLESLRRTGHPCIVIMITTDKVYENKEWDYAYRENDPLGGDDLYSASKACAEKIIAAYRRSFFSAWHDAQAPVTAIASARGGNIIGGGDWAADRLFPDCMRGIAAGRAISVRNPHATRPWQHVIALVSGYLDLAAQMREAQDSGDKSRLQTLCSSFNFGPGADSNRSVADMVEETLKHWPGEWQYVKDSEGGHEAEKLNLSTEKAYHLLGWRSRWNFSETVRNSVEWYRQYYTENSDSAAMSDLCRRQILAYQQTGQEV